MKIILSVLFLSTRTVMILVAADVPFYEVEPCADEEEALDFHFVSDAQSFLENGWKLRCDGANNGTSEIVWDVPPGTLKYSASNHIIKESTCIAPTMSCVLTIMDLEGDGLSVTHPSNGSTGWFTFFHGATTVASYNTESNTAFSELEYCVGPVCNHNTSLPVVETKSTKECKTVYLYMQMDGNPQDTSYTLKCDGETIWDESKFSTSGAFVEEEWCVEQESCCTFTINDADAQGMTTQTQEGCLGFLFLEWNASDLLEYDGVTGETFDQKSVRFGHGCRDGWQDKVELPPEQETRDPTSTGQHGNGYGGPVAPEYLNDVVFKPDDQPKGKLGNGAMMTLIILISLILCCCLIVASIYRHVLQRDVREIIKDDPSIYPSADQDDPSFKGAPLSSKDQHQEPDIIYGDEEFLDNNGEDCHFGEI